MAVLRATTTDGAFRVFATISTAEVADLGARGGELATAEMLLREVTGEDGEVRTLPGEDVSSGLMRALRERDVPAMAAVVALPGPDGVRVAGGYVVQLLPAATREVIDELTDHLGNLDPLSTILDGRTPSPAGLIAILMAGVPHQLG